MRIKTTAAAAAAAVAVMFASSVQAAEFVTNGSFEDSSFASNSQFGAGYGGQGVTGWEGLGGNHLQFYYHGGTQSSASGSAANQFNDPGAYFYPTFNTLSSDGGNFVGLDGDSDYAGQISQTINGLVIGQTYTLNFDWAAAQLVNRTGATTEQLLVTFGDQSFTTDVTPNASGGFSGWLHASTTFTATSTSQVLSFLSVGTPNGLPPIAALDGVSLTGGVPEPGVWAMMLVGFGGIGALLRRRRGVLAAA